MVKLSFAVNLQTKFKLAWVILLLQARKLTWGGGKGAMVNYEENEKGLKQLLAGLEVIPGTFPPVYIWGDMLIRYDGSGKIRVISAVPSPPIEPKTSWLKRWRTKLTSLTTFILPRPTVELPQGGQNFNSAVLPTPKTNRPQLSR